MDGNRIDRLLVAPHAQAGTHASAREPGKAEGTWPAR
jgi:hypothetical protein